jgi:hypothetical protein
MFLLVVLHKFEVELYQKLTGDVLIKLRARNTSKRTFFRQDTINLWTFGNYISPMTTEEQPVSVAAPVCKEEQKINHVKIKFISQMS